MTAAWAGTICSDPVMVSVSIRPERYSHDVIARTGEFVINLTTEDLTYAADFCGVRSGRDVDKFEYLHLTKVPSAKVKAPSIGESPVCLECVVTGIEELGTHDLFIAKVVQVSVDEKYLDEKGRFMLEEAGLVAYVHGSYLSLGDRLGTFGFSVRKKGGETGKRSSMRNADTAAKRKKEESAGSKKDQSAAQADTAAGRKKEESAGHKKEKSSGQTDTAAGRKKDRPAGQKRERSAGKADAAARRKKTQYARGKDTSVRRSKKH